MHESPPSCPRCDLPLAGDPAGHASLACPEPYCDYALPASALRPAQAAAEPLGPPPWLRLAS